MKTAKEWAESVVSSTVRVGNTWGVNLGSSDEEYVCFQRQIFEQDADTLAADARGIIERLVERVQEDALPSDLMRQIEKLADDMEREGEKGIAEPDRMYERAVLLLRKLVQR